MVEIDPDLNQLISRCHTAFLAIDADALAALWDKTHAPLVYVAMEKEEPIRGWPAIRGYYDALPTVLARMTDMRVSNLEIDTLGNVALAYFDFAATAELRQTGATISPAGRVTIAFHRTASGWRMIHYHESALAASAEQVK